MLGRRGFRKAVSLARKMAGKKGAVVQLQSEVNTDEDWDRLLQKQGLVVVDIYSDWCGPCVGMVGNLKKIKLDIGGDLLHLAIAKADGIDILKRFRDRSEPTWMFIGSGHLVNLMFGANAPRLSRLITTELAKEAAVLKGEQERETLPFDELTPEERIRFEATEKIRLAELAEKEAAIERAKEFTHQRLVARLVRELKDYTLIVYFPFTFSSEENQWKVHIKVMEILVSHGANIKEEYQKEMDCLTAWQIFHSNLTNVPVEWKELLEKGTYNIKLVKRTKREPILVSAPESELNIDPLPPPCDMAEVMATELYGFFPLETDNDSFKISPNSLVMLFSKSNIPGLWTPITPVKKAEALIQLFPEFTEKFAEPEPEILPPHLLLVFKATVLEDILELLPEYEHAILKLGIFEVNPPNFIKLIGNTPEDFFSLQVKTGKERLVVILDNADPDALLTLSQFMPIYISPSVEAGESDSRSVFPPCVERGDIPSEPIENFPPLLLGHIEGRPNLGRQDDGEEDTDAAAEQDASLDDDHTNLI